MGTEAQFDVHQDAADQLAYELNSLAALIRAHTRHRERKLNSLKIRSNATFYCSFRVDRAMSNQMKMWNASYSLSLQAARVAWEAQSVVMLRCMQIAAESAQGRQTETRRMVTEKIAALAEAQVALRPLRWRAAAASRSRRRLWGCTKTRSYATSENVTRAIRG